MRQTMAVVLVAVMCAFTLLSAPPTRAQENSAGQNAGWLRTAQDDQGNIHMVTAFAWGACYYSKYTASSGTWSSPVPLPNSSPAWFDFTNPDIDVGPDGRPQVVYGINTGDYPNDLEFVYYAKANDVNGTSWSLTTIGGDGFRRNHARIAVDENNIAHITYMKTNKYQPWWWEIIYRRPDGTEKVIQHTSPESYRCNNPDIAYKDGIVHIAWYEGGSGTMTTNIMHAAGAPYSDFPVFEQLTNMPYKWFVGDPGIAVSPSGEVDIVYIVADFNTDPGIYKGVYSTRTGVVDGGWSYVDEEQEDWGPSIAFMDNGTRYVGWSHHHNNETMYVRNSEPKVTLTPWGNIDVFAGPDKVFYVRCHGAPGQIYYHQLEIGPPPNQTPVASFSITPQTGDILTSFVFDASASNDPDNNLPLTYRWDWNNDGSFDLVQVGVATASQSFPYPGIYPIKLQVEDALGARDDTTQSLEIINHPPVAAFTTSIVGRDSVLFDASPSSDLEDSTSLMYRWDWDSDGTFDTMPLTDPQILHVFPGPGLYQVTLRVRDMCRAHSDTTQPVELIVPAPATALQASIEAIGEGWLVTLTWIPSPSPDVAGQTVQRSTDGTSWEDRALLLPDATTHADTVNEAGMFWYRIATSSAFYVSYSESVLVEAVSADNHLGVPAALTLTDLVPNPTSGRVVLRVGIPHAGTATVTLHDLAGRVVARRCICAREPGWIESRWNLSDNAIRAGTYVVRVQMDSVSMSRPLVVVR